MNASFMIAIVASLACATLSLNCYKCNMCSHKIHKKYIKPCPQEEGYNETFSCVRVIFEDSKKKEIIYFRKCMTKKKADELCTLTRPDVKPLNCLVCDTDACNGDSTEFAPPKQRGAANSNRPIAVAILFFCALTRLIAS